MFSQSHFHADSIYVCFNFFLILRSTRARNLQVVNDQKDKAPRILCYLNVRFCNLKRQEISFYINFNFFYIVDFLAQWKTKFNHFSSNGFELECKFPNNHITYYNLFLILFEHINSMVTYMNAVDKYKAKRKIIIMKQFENAWQKKKKPIKSDACVRLTDSKSMFDAINGII